MIQLKYFIVVQFLHIIQHAPCIFINCQILRIGFPKMTMGISRDQKSLNSQPHFLRVQFLFHLLQIMICNQQHQTLDYLQSKNIQTRQIQNMEIEKHLFKIAEKSNAGEFSGIFWKVIYMVSLTLTVLFSLAFLFGELYVDHHYEDLRKCLIETDFVMQMDEVGFIFENEKIITDAYTKMKEKANKDNKVQGQISEVLYKDKESCTIYKNLIVPNLTEGSLYSNSLAFSYGKAITLMSLEERQSFNVNNYTLVIKNPPNILIRGIYNYYVMLTRQFVKLKDQNLIKTTMENGLPSQFGIYIKIGNDHIISNYKDSFSEKSIFHHLKQFVEIIFIYALSSIVTAFYIYITIVAAPAVILLVLSLTPYGRGQQFNQAHKAFPWIGMHTLIIKSAQNRHVRNHYHSMCFGLLYHFLCLYLAYYLTIYILSISCFKFPAESGVGEIFFGYIAIIEFCSLIFMRTRPFVKYFPVIHTIAILLFLLYCFQSHFGYKFFLVMVVQLFGFTLFSWMMFKLEVPAQHQWDRTRAYVPSINQPRAGLMPAFSLNWINGLPADWAMLFPLASKSSFNNKQLSFVNRNYQLVNQYLSETNNQRQEQMGENS